jgi:hypothetical protein
VVQLYKPILHTYEWPNITIGNNLDALLHAYETKSYFICNDKLDYLFYDKLIPDLEVPPKLKFTSGESLHKVFSDIAYHLSYIGRNTLGLNVDGINLYPEENYLTISYENETKFIKVNYEYLRIFDINNINGIPFETDDTINYYHVYDWFEEKGTKYEPKELIDKESDFVKKVIFFKKFGMRKGFVCESILIDLHDMDYSSNMARLKTLEMMAPAGKSSGYRVYLTEREVRVDSTLEYFKQGNIEVGRCKTPGS